MSNIHFQQKIASDELRDTIFFSTGQYTIKQKVKDIVILTSPLLEIKISNFKNITVNGSKCRSVYEAKIAIMEIA